MKKNFVLFTLIPIMFIGCVPKSKYDDLLKEKLSLEIEIDELKNGESRLISIIDSAYEKSDFETAKKNISLLEKKHPESKKNAEYKKLLIEIENKEKEIELQKQKEAEEKERLANLNNTGNWEICNYVDSFGEYTDEKYIRLKCKGYFSNSATTNSKLEVKFLIDSKDEIAFKLYEYGGYTEVKGGYGSSKLRAYLTIRDKDGKESPLITGVNSSDRFSFGPNASNLIHNAFLKGGVVKFSLSVSEDYGSDSSYRFTVDDANYYDNAYRILTTGK